MSHYSEVGYDYANIRIGPGNSHHLPGEAKFADDYHVFLAEWTGTEVYTGVDTDDVQMMFENVTQFAAFDAPMYIILNIAIGGDFPGAPDATTVFPQEMRVDWVRVYAQNGEAIMTDLNPPTDAWVPESAARYGYGAAPVWAEEFNDALDTNRWTRDTGASTRDNELQYLSDDTKYSQTANGDLVVTATSDAGGGRAFTSARLTTARSMAFRHGLFAARMKLPMAQGVRAMVELLGLGELYSEAIIAALQGDASSSGDAAAAAVVTPYETRIRFQMPGETSPSADAPGWQFTTLNGRPWSDAYHVFWFEWTPHAVWVGVDFTDRRMIVSDLTNLPAFQADMHLVVDLAVVVANTTATAAGSTTAAPPGLPAQMHVDWIRVYALNGEDILRAWNATSTDPNPDGASAGSSSSTAAGSSTGPSPPAIDPIDSNSHGSSASASSVGLTFFISVLLASVVVTLDA